MLPTLKITTKSAYGTPYLYPGCEITRTIVTIKGGKTLAARDIQLLRQAGFPVEVRDEQGQIIKPIS